MQTVLARQVDAAVELGEERKVAVDLAVFGPVTLAAKRDQIGRVVGVDEADETANWKLVVYQLCGAPLTLFADTSGCDNRGFAGRLPSPAVRSFVSASPSWVDGADVELGLPLCGARDGTEWALVVVVGCRSGERGTAPRTLKLHPVTLPGGRHSPSGLPRTRRRTELLAAVADGKARSTRLARLRGRFSPSRRQVTNARTIALVSSVQTVEVGAALVARPRGYFSAHAFNIRPAAHKDKCCVGLEERYCALAARRLRAAEAQGTLPGLSPRPAPEQARLPGVER